MLTFRQKKGIIYRNMDCGRTLRKSFVFAGVTGTSRIKQSRPCSALRCRKVITMTRREAREQVLALLFETAFRTDETPEAIFALASEIRELDSEDFIRNTYFGTMENVAFIDEKIAEFSNGWSAERISPVSRAIMRLCVYEMFFNDEVPDNVAVNEALELVKKFDDEDKVKRFVNGVLNSVLKSKQGGGEA